MLDGKISFTLSLCKLLDSTSLRILDWIYSTLLGKLGEIKVLRFEDLSPMP